MKTQSVYRLMMVPALLLLFFAIGCDSGGGLGGDVNSEQAWFRVDCYMLQGTTQMVFEATGVVSDEGTIEGNPLPENAGSDTWVRYRMLQGNEGGIVLRLEGRSVAYGARVAEGTFTILEGSDAYAGLQGQGDFHATFSEKAGLVEIFEGLVK